jgi:hypothetical protein
MAGQMNLTNVNVEAASALNPDADIKLADLARTLGVVLHTVYKWRDKGWLHVYPGNKFLTTGAWVKAAIRGEKVEDAD